MSANTEGVTNDRLSDVSKRLMRAADRLSRQVSKLRFAEPVTHVYNPLEYARSLHHQYLRMASSDCRVLFLGMNPGPWGMAQTGVPFGEVTAVRRWLGIGGDVERPKIEHPKRPIEGLQCGRSEVSGRRLWGLMEDHFGTAESFFRHHFVVNYCPLVFMESSGRNRTPDKLPAVERDLLREICDEHLRGVLGILGCHHLVGVGVYAEQCLKRVAEQLSDRKRSPPAEFQIVRILHPSPASPAANRNWAGSAVEQLRAAGIWQS